MRFRQPNGSLSQICKPDGRLNPKANEAMRRRSGVVFIRIGLSAHKSANVEPKPTTLTETRRLCSEQ
jgi:hypothetical protein